MAVVDPVFQGMRACQFSGANSTEVLGMMNTYTNIYSITSTSPTSLVIDSSMFGISVTMANTDWVVMNTAIPFGTFTNTDYNAMITSKDKIVADAVAAAVANPVQALGVATVPSLVANAQSTVQVTIKPTLATTSYSVASAISGGITLLSALSILSTTIVSGSRVDVVVKNTGLVTLSGALVTVVAVV